MTKEDLQSYLKIKKELRQMTRLMRSPEANIAYDTEDGRTLLALYRAKRDDLVATQKRIEDAIDALGPTERTILRARYLEGRSWTAICQEVHYSRTQAIRIHDKAVRMLGENRKGEQDGSHQNRPTQRAGTDGAAPVCR